MKKRIITLLFLPLLQLAQAGQNIASCKINTTNHLTQYYSANSVAVNNLNNISEAQQAGYGTDTVWVNIPQNKEMLVSSVYPNPAGNFLHINYDGDPAEIRIYTVMGTLVYSVTDNTGMVDISNFAPGIYHLRLTTGNKINNHIFVKQ
jgi:hypothetical protein